MAAPADQKNLLEVLEELLLDPGWSVFKAHADNEWGPRQYRTRVQAALTTDTPEASVIAVECAATEIERLLQWPEEQVNRLRARIASERARQMTTTAGPRA